MNTEELLQELSLKINTGEISREDIEARFNSIPSSKSSSSFSLTKMLYVLGAAIVVIGIIIFVSQIWYDIESIGRIMVTLGLGLIIAALGSALLKRKPGQNIGTVFHAIGGILIPGGAMVTLSEFQVDSVSLWPVAVTFGVIFTFYVLLNSIHKNPILTFFDIVNGTAFVYLLVASILESSYYSGTDDLYAYLTMLIGGSYLLLAQAFRDSWNKNLTGFLYLFGIIGILGAAFSQVFGSIIWQLLYFGILVGGLALSVYMKSRIILIISTLFLIIHVSYITGEYFADSLGWPISLVILGFIFIGLGYMSVNINKKYITS